MDDSRSEAGAVSGLPEYLFEETLLWDWLSKLPFGIQSWRSIALHPNVDMTKVTKWLNPNALRLAAT